MILLDPFIIVGMHISYCHSTLSNLRAHQIQKGTKKSAHAELTLSSSINETGHLYISKSLFYLILSINDIINS